MGDEEAFRCLAPMNDVSPHSNFNHTLPNHPKKPLYFVLQKNKNCTAAAAANFWHIIDFAIVDYDDDDDDDVKEKF